MDARQTRQLDALKRSLLFVTTSPLPTPLQNPSSGLTTQVAALRTAIDGVQTQATDQISGLVRQTVDQRNQARDALRTAHLEPILHVARVLERSTPGLPRLVNLRSARGGQAVLSAAQAALRDLAPYKDQFVAAGLPADFLDELQTAVAAYEAATNAVREAKVTQIQARAGIETALTDGDNRKRVIGALIRRAAVSDPNGKTFLRGWDAASHVKRGKAGGPGAGAGTSTAPAPAPSETNPSPTTSTSPSTNSTPTTSATPASVVTAAPAPTAPAAAPTAAAPAAA